MDKTVVVDRRARQLADSFLGAHKQDQGAPMTSLQFITAEPGVLMLLVLLLLFGVAFGLLVMQQEILQRSSSRTEALLSRARPAAALKLPSKIPMRLAAAKPITTPADAPAAGAGGANATTLAAEAPVPTAP